MTDEDITRWRTECRNAIASVESAHKSDPAYAGMAARDAGERLRALSHHLSGVACKACDGYGQRAYTSTALWRGGVGGQAMTGGVCDKCWGTGRTDETGPDLRSMEAAARAAVLVSVRKWLASYLGVGFRGEAERFGVVADKLKRARWPDMWTRHAADRLASLVRELILDEDER